MQMDKHKPHYELEDIKREFSTVESIRMTAISKLSMEKINLRKSDVLKIILFRIFLGGIFTNQWLAILIVELGMMFIMQNILG